jgi:hypothetical protein
MVLRRLDLPPAGERPVSPQSRVKAITEDRVGRLWISTQSGTFRLEGPSWTSLESLGGPLGTASTEFTDSDGRIWFGFRNNTIAMLDGNKVRYFSGKESVQVGAVTSIQGEGARIWIGGESGLEFFDGSRFHPIDPADGSSFGGISGVIANPRDGLWFAENRGIVHIPASQLRHLGSGKMEFESFGLLDGLTGQLRGPLASPSVAQTTDGRIWFATTKGLAWIDPKRIVRNEFRPPVSIESVVGNGHRYDNLTCQEQEFERLGSGRTHRINVRLIAATHRNLTQMVARNDFRSDLYYRINIFPVLMPPLRERRDDIPQLVLHFVEGFSRRMGKRIVQIPQTTMSAFSTYDWPGNVRELQNLVERAVIRSDNGVLPDPFLTMLASSGSLIRREGELRATEEPCMRTGLSAFSKTESTDSLEDLKRRHIIRVLERTDCVISGPSGAATILNIHPNTLRSLMDRLGIMLGPSRSTCSAGPALQ